MQASEPTELSVIIPAYNEAASLPLALPRIVSELAQLVSRFEIVIVNDGSSDQTAAVADELAKRHRFVRAIHFSRNFGKEAALEAGLTYARGRGLLFIDADLQHPPALIPQMIRAWRAGADVVNARKRHRGEERAAYGAASRLFYRMFERATGFAFEGASDYKLLDRQVADALLRCPERDRFFRGLVAWVGFHQVDIPFDVAPREAGRSSWSVAGLMRYSLRSLVAFSSLPLQAVAMAGFAGVVLSFLLILQTVARYLSGNALDGFTTVIIAQAAFSSLLLLAVGVLAVYLARVYDAQKQRPSFFVRDPDAGVRSGTVLRDMEIQPAPPRVRKPVGACDTDHSRVDHELL
ncbi:glycosyltransferase family 2 protein [Cupriavidus taiwanensis]|nr:glycosyltransferase family 2 protein [Cupriavidus taiwanensis]